MDTIKLDKVAGAISVHPRTVLRAIAGKTNEYWAPGYNPDLDLATVAAAYDMPAEDFEKMIARVARKNSKEELLTVREAFDCLEELDGTPVSIHTVRRRYPAVIRTPGTVRYLKSHIIDHYIAQSI